MKNLEKLYQQYKDKKCSIENLSRQLSCIVVPEEMQNKVDDAEYQIEKIRFCVSSNDQYNKVLKVLNDLFK